MNYLSLYKNELFIVILIIIIGLLLYAYLSYKINRFKPVKPQKITSFYELYKQYKQYYNMHPELSMEKKRSYFRETLTRNNKNEFNKLIKEANDFTF